MIPLFEAPTVTNSFQAWFKTVPLNTQFPSLFFLLQIHYLDCDSFLSTSRIYQTDQRQNMSE